MKHFTDEEVIDNMNKHYQYCIEQPRVNSGSSRGSRNHGDNANSSTNWIMWRKEARERGLV